MWFSVRLLYTQIDSYSMSNSRKETVSDCGPEFDLSGALGAVCQQGESQVVELMEKRLVLNTVQAKLSKTLKSYDTVISNIKLRERNISDLTSEIQQIQKHNETQQTQIQIIFMDNIKLKHSIEQQMENSHLLLAGYNTYRNKIESYKTAVSVLESQSALHKELTEKREEVMRLRACREELSLDLQNLEGNAVTQAQRQIDTIRAKIHCVKELLAGKRILWEKEKETHSQLRKEIEIHNRRCEAIVKRLRCQLNKAQCNHRLLSTDIFHMEKEVENLRSQLEISHSTLNHQ